MAARLALACAIPSAPALCAAQAAPSTTVVQWDQRGAGKSYNANDPATIGPTRSLDRITEDAAEVVQHLRQRYGKDRVFVLGQSWGSLVGLGLARRHPELRYAYTGMGPVITRGVRLHARHGAPLPHHHVRGALRHDDAGRRHRRMARARVRRTSG